MIVINIVVREKRLLSLPEVPVPGYARCSTPSLKKTTFIDNSLHRNLLTKSGMF